MPWKWKKQNGSATQWGPSLYTTREAAAADAVCPELDYISTPEKAMRHWTELGWQLVEVEPVQRADGSVVYLEASPGRYDSVQGLRVFKVPARAHQNGRDLVVSLYVLAETKPSAKLTAKDLMKSGWEIVYKGEGAVLEEVLDGEIEEMPTLVVLPKGRLALLNELKAFDDGEAFFRDRRA